MGIIEKIKEIEAEMARTQKNKATGTCSIYMYFAIGVYVKGIVV